ncbi:prolipoprotein diacylglyceryl transferase [Salidesulfovibrio brasiliensis]|uniref:prolipoprotein diacylglyceryl transferase n=1 Tax=Salidesulfovibrio brasiliensis TaxID=221711 RepID=UPI0006D0EF31|nr:prolipoprotein diacylglyceryl transferase family protein [Salidesulfovibrio brasiliensis]
MHPVLIRLGPLTLHWYGVLVALAFLAAIWWAMREADRRELDRNVVPDLAFWVVVGAIGGARLLYVLIDLPYFLKNPLQIFAFWEGGLVFSGGLALARCSDTGRCAASRASLNGATPSRRESRWDRP